MDANDALRYALIMLSHIGLIAVAVCSLAFPAYGNDQSRGPDSGSALSLSSGIKLKIINANLINWPNRYYEPRPMYFRDREVAMSLEELGGDGSFCTLFSADRYGIKDGLTLSFASIHHGKFWRLLGLNSGDFISVDESGGFVLSCRSNLEGEKVWTIEELEIIFYSRIVPSAIK